MDFPLPNVRKFNRLVEKKQEDQKVEKYSLIVQKINEYPNRLDIIATSYYLKSRYFSDILASIRDKRPDIIAFQGVAVGHESLISIPGYQSIFYTGEDRNTGYVTLWNPSKFTLKSHLFVDFYVSPHSTRSETKTGLITILNSFKEDHDLCIINSETNEYPPISESQLYTLLHFSKELSAQWHSMLLLGNYFMADSIACPAKLNITPEGLSLIRALEFEQNASVIYCYLKKSIKHTLSALSCLSKFSSGPQSFYSKGPIQPTLISSLPNLLSIEFNLNIT